MIVGMYVVQAAISVTREESVDDEGKQPEDDRAKDKEEEIGVKAIAAIVDLNTV